MIGHRGSIAYPRTWLYAPASAHSGPLVVDSPPVSGSSLLRWEGGEGVTVDDRFCMLCCATALVLLVRMR